MLNLKRTHLRPPAPASSSRNPAIEQDMSFCTVNVQNDTGACAGYLPIWGQKDRLHVTLYGKRTHCNPAAEGTHHVIKRMHSMSFCTFTVQNTLFAPVQNVCAQHMHEIACWEACALTFPLPLNQIIFGAPTCLSIIFLVFLSNTVWVYFCPVFSWFSCTAFFGFLCACLLFGVSVGVSGNVLVGLFFVRLSCHFYVVEPKLLHTIFFLYHVEYCCYRLRGSCYGEGYFCIFPSAVGAIGIIYLQVHC